MSKALADYLSDFGNDGASSDSSGPEFQEVVSMLPKGYGEGGDWVTRVFEAYENGFSEGQEAVKAETEATIAAMKEELAQKLVDGEKAWKESQGAELKAEVDKALKDVEERVAASVSQILVPFLESQARERAVSTLADVLKRYVSTNPLPIIEVLGPKTLQDLFAGHVDEQELNITYKEIPSEDLTVKIGEMHLSSGLGGWVDQLHKLVSEIA
ncbi:hypothetical protein [Flexibacterium corallicola]|uniref:hypothetical protein n=1 Tax=Flexibacterium corallicola TaxID=3037259 RepID=UPI00286F8440|nr:hypothetical protein [Pseudovibrio sp. M1P-2-3]